MNRWECGVCGYLHEGDEVPEKCPVCEAPGEKFIEVTPTEGVEKERPAVESAVKKWRCTVCGYVHTGIEPPDICPVCGAGSDKFEELVDEENGEDASTITGKRWKCTVCGYIHTGQGPPEKCPVCGAPAEMFLELDKNGNEIGSLPVEEGEQGSERISPSLFDSIADLFVRHHLHPISVHFPNGILPVVFAFLAISVWFNIASLEAAAFYNLIAVLLALPLVLLTGYLEWQKRFKGIKTSIFIIKMICGLVVLASTNVLVFWRIIDPGVAAADSPVKWIYLGIAAVLLGAAGLAGHLGGKLSFGTRDGG